MFWQHCFLNFLFKMAAGKFIIILDILVTLKIKTPQLDGKEPYRTRFVNYFPYKIVGNKLKYKTSEVNK